MLARKYLMRNYLTQKFKPANLLLHTSKIVIKKQAHFLKFNRGNDHLKNYGTVNCMMAACQSFLENLKCENNAQFYTLSNPGNDLDVTERGK